jgi:hypothetical protein
MYLHSMKNIARLRLVCTGDTHDLPNINGFVHNTYCPCKGGGHALLSLLFVSFRLEGVSTPSLGTIGLQTYIPGETKVSKNFLLNQESLRDFGNLFQSSNHYKRTRILGTVF